MKKIELLNPVISYIEELESSVDNLELNIEEKDLVISGLNSKVSELEGKVGDLENQITSLTTPERLDKVDRLITVAFFAKHLDIQYKFGAEYHNDQMMDCSSFMQTIFKFIGVDLPRTSRSQSKVGVEVKPSDVKKGDLVFFDTNGDGVINHVGLYIGNQEMIHTNSPTTDINVLNIMNYNNGIWRKRLVTIRRVL